MILSIYQSATKLTQLGTKTPANIANTSHCILIPYSLFTTTFNSKISSPQTFKHFLHTVDKKN